MKLEAFIAMNTIYLCTIIPLAGIIFLVSRFVFKIKAWYFTDLLTVFIPGIFYWFLDINGLRFTGGSLSNMVAEPVFIGIGCAIIFLLRIILSKKNPNYSKKYSLIAFAAVLIVTALIEMFTPFFPE